MEPMRVVLTSEPHFWALVGMQPALSEVGVGLKILGGAGVTGVVGKFASVLGDASSGLPEGAMDSFVLQLDASGQTSQAVAGVTEGGAVAEPAAGGGEAVSATTSAPAAADAQEAGGTFAAGAASAEAARAARSWLPWLVVLPALLAAVTKCQFHMDRSCRRCVKLYGYSRLSAAARWNFEYVHSMCCDPRDVSVFVWGFPDAAQGEAVQGANH